MAVMKCIFCKQDSTESYSEEHILPESLGNTKAVLPPGIVCDACNNYFACKIEKPFLESPAIKALRFHQSIVSKRGRVPPIDGILTPGFPATVYRHLQGPFIGTISTDIRAVEHMLQTKNGMLIFPASGEPPKDLIASRFLAKIAIEALADRLRQHPGGIQYLINEAQFDTIRRHAREGQPKQWPYHLREIYDPDRRLFDEAGRSVQTVYEFDLLYTARGELYLVLAIFGREFAINIGGPEISGYLQWIEENNGASPLYTGNNDNTNNIERF